VTTPGAGATPSAWSCVSGQDPDAPAIFTVSCTPAVVGTWSCQAHHALVTVTGAFVEVEGSVGCANRLVHCQPSMADWSGMSYCEVHVAGESLGTFTCRSREALPVTGAQWTVRCRTYYTP
jgi:hypothetical protein